MRKSHLYTKLKLFFKNMLTMSVGILFLLVLEVRIFIFKKPEFQELVILTLIKYGSVGFLVTVVYLSQESIFVFFLLEMEAEPPLEKNQHLKSLLVELFIYLLIYSVDPFLIVLFCKFSWCSKSLLLRSFW